jgi:dihydroorotate dehydrogenase (NAD+) catalytic subunit
MGLEIKIGKTIFKNPVFLASGTISYGEELKRIIDLNKIGAIVTKAITLNPKEGYNGLRMVETPAGIINRIGLQNIGLENFIKYKIKFLEKLKTSVIVNIAGESIEEYKIIIEKLDNIKKIDAYEVNVSCPNVEKGGIEFSEDEKTFKKLLKKLRNITDKTLIVKLSPSALDIKELSIMAEKIGMDAVTINNTFKAMIIDTKTKEIKIKGGLSGPAIYPIALNNVYEISKKINIPVIASGGIYNEDVALQFLIAGAKAIQIGTFNFIDPKISIKILNKFKKNEYFQR